jgi:hypothetical protein
LELVSLHVYAAAAEGNSFGFQSKPLLDCGIAPQLNFPTGAQNTVPR